MELESKVKNVKGEIINVRIYNQNITLSTDGRDPGYVKRLAQELDSRMRKISETSPIVDTRKVAIQAALDIADELMRLKESKNTIKEEVSDQIINMVNLIEQALK